MSSAAIFITTIAATIRSHSTTASFSEAGSATGDFVFRKQFFDSLAPGDYEVCIRTRETPGTLKILEYVHTGSLDQTIVFGGNLDHAGVANDGLAGCVVGLELMRRLRGRKTRFTYSLVLSPGILGSELYLASLEPRERARLFEGAFLEMLGSDTQFAVQESRHTLAHVHHALRESLRHLGLSFRTGPFESIIVNDEYVWENFGIPMVSFSRFPYPEYHSSLDSMDIIRETSMNEAVEAMLGAIDILEATPLIVKKFQGNICLSNPRYNLYVDYGQVALGDTLSDQARRMRALMDFVPSLDRPISISVIANHIGVSEKDAEEYLRQWAAKGLIELV